MMHYFDMDTTERVNVNTLKFKEKMMIDKQGERGFMRRGEFRARTKTFFAY